MDAFGCHIVSTLCADNEEGFSSTVTKGEVIRGPFPTIMQALECARDWDVVALPVVEVPAKQPTVPEVVIDPTTEPPAE